MEKEKIMNIENTLPMNTKQVEFCGKLHTPGQTYFLIHPEPVVRDSWQPDGALRFLVVPDKKLGKKGNVDVYSYPRHIVTNCYTVEYNYVPVRLQENDTSVLLTVLDLGSFGVEESNEVLELDLDEFQAWAESVASEEI